MNNADLVNDGTNIVQHYNKQTMELVMEDENIPVLERQKKMTGQ